MSTSVLRLTAFAAGPSGGNPAGVVLDASDLTDAQMQRIATRVGYAETAFVVRPPAPGPDGVRAGLRYFSPSAEVPFCGHATIATAVALAWRDGVGTTVFETPAGPFEVRTARADDGVVTASFTSAEPRVELLPDHVLARLLDVVGLAPEQLHPAYPPRAAYAGNVHPVLVVADVAALDGVRFDPAELRAFMDTQGWAATVTIAHPRDAGTFEARNPFPVGTLDEDPATGSAAAALGGYLRELGLVEPPVRVLVHQGRHVGRPSLLAVDVPATGGIVVTGTASPVDDPR